MFPMLLLEPFQPILYSHYAACAQEMDQNTIEKNAAIFRFKNWISV